MLFYSHKTFILICFLSVLFCSLTWKQAKLNILQSSQNIPASKLLDFFCLYLFFHLIFLISIATTLIYANTNASGQRIDLRDLRTFGNSGKRGGGGGKGGDFFIYFYEMFSAKLNLYLGMRQSRL